MNRYSVYVQDGNKPEEFLQSSALLANVKKDKSTIDRWLVEMGISFKDAEKVVFNIYDQDGTRVFTRRFVGVGSRSWVKV